MNSSLINIEKSSGVFQNLGAWGEDGEPLLIKCGSSLSDIEIFIDTTSPEILNIGRVELILKNEDNIITSSQMESAQLSSNFYFDVDGSNNVTSRLIKGELIHSSREIRPTLKIKLKTPLLIEAIKIYNRPGICGLRSRYIAINGLLENNLKFSFYNVSDDLKRRLATELNSVLSTYCKPINLPENTLASDGYLRSIVCERIEAGEIVSEELLSALLPVSSPMPRLDHLSATYISRAIEKQLETKAYIPLRDLKKFSAVLCDDVSIDTLGDFASKLISEKGKQVKVVVAKHRVHLNTLLSNKEAHLDFLDRLLESLSSLDAIPMVAYGTLLGAYREGAFLPADDDLDIILFFSGVKNEAEKKSEKLKLFKFLKNLGYKVGIQEGRPHLSVNSMNASVAIDIFPAWESMSPGSVSLVMQKLAYRDISSSVLLPPSEIKVYGRSYPCPANVEAFLEDRYGEGWKKSDPYHEWSWPLARRAYFKSEVQSSVYDLRESQRHRRVGRNRTQLIAWSQCVLQEKRPPSNSIPMLLQAVEHGYDVVELDIRCAKNGDVILAHDNLIHNDDGEQIYLSKSSLDELLNFRLGTYDDENVFIASLDQALPHLEGKQVLLDARFSASDYVNLRACVDRVGFDSSMLLFCVYNENQIAPLMRYFPESLLFWKFYTQAWEIDKLALRQVRQYGMDGIMYMYPHFDEDISDSLYEIKRHDLQSMCFIHGASWTPPHSSGLSPNREVRSKDNYNLSLKKMVSMGIEYVTTTACKSHIFKELLS